MHIPKQLTGVQSPAAVHRDEIQATINRLDSSRTSSQHIGPERPKASHGGDRTQCHASQSYGQKGPDEKPPDITDIVTDWQDFVLAKEAIPDGAACGPDGVPVRMIKKAKVPISRLINKAFQSSLQTGEIPTILKSAYIPGIHKGGSRPTPVNYRPISLTSHVVKTMERVFRKALVGYLELYNKLDPQQHGSRTGRSTLSQLLQHQDEILSGLEEGANLDFIYLDFSKAYDKVDHGILLHKLKDMGISGRIGRWIRNFLLPRKQQVA